MKPPITFDWNHARAFLATVEHGSLSAAARAIGASQPTLGRQAAALEEQLGVTLFERVGHRLVPTAAALDLVEPLRAMSAEAERVSRLAAGQAQRVEGVVRIAASEAVSAFLLPRVVGELRRAHPDLEIELVVSNQVSDLRRREADIAVRHARPTGDALIGRLVRERCVARLYGAPRYLAKLGRPRTRAELAAKAQVLGFDATDVMRRGLAALGLPLEARQFPVRTDAHLVQWELAKAGIGLCAMMEEVGRQEPKVREALPKDPIAITYPTWLVCHRELKTSRKIRVVFDALAEGLWG